MKKTVKGCLAILALSAVASLAQAAQPGTYAGLGLGWSKLEANNPFNDIAGTSMSRKSTQTGAAGRLFAGYNFNQNVGVEAGLAKYADADLKATYTQGGNSLTAKQSYKLSSLDVVAKGYLPVSDSGFNVYGLAGLALVHSKATLAASGAVNDKETKTQNKIRPIYGIGASYDIPQTKLATNLEFTRIQGYGNTKTNKSAIPNADLVTLNLVYNIG